MSAKMNPSRLLMPLAFASSMGGMMTLIGTPPNLVIQNTLTSAGFEPLSFFTFLPVGLVSVAVGTLVLMPLSKWFLSKKGQKDDNSRSGKSLKQLVNEYGLSSNLFRMQVIKDSAFWERPSSIWIFVVNMDLILWKSVVEMLRSTVF